MSTIEDVVGRDMCVGCGACRAATGGRIPVTIGRFGAYGADLTGVPAATRATGSTVCPFAHESRDEDAVAAEAYPDLPRDERLGRVRTIRAGRVADDARVRGSSSGGLTTWVLDAALRGGLVDGVIHVGPGADGRFGYTVSRSPEELPGRRGSIYTSTTLGDALLTVRGDGGRYAVVGVPCFITASRHLADRDPVLREQIALRVGLVCGHLKTSAYAELLAWQTGIAPGDLRSTDFRVKRPGHDAGDYGFRATDIAGHTVTRPSRDLVGSNWGHAMMQLEACDFCDDIFAETADVTLGDAWLDRYRRDWRGTNVVVSRDARIDALLDRGVASGELVLDPLTPDDAAATQAGNFRHRRDGLSVRLADDVAAGLWVPRKRVTPGQRSLSERRERLVRQRRLISRESHLLFARARERGELRVFLDGMRAPLATYLELDLGPLLGRLLARHPRLGGSRLLRGRGLRAVRRALGVVRRWRERRVSRDDVRR
jgi:coenzyme F420-reducing hydrogenase beta subunit